MLRTISHGSSTFLTLLSGPEFCCDDIDTPEHPWACRAGLKRLQQVATTNSTVCSVKGIPMSKDVHTSKLILGTQPLRHGLGWKNRHDQKCRYVCTKILPKAMAIGSALGCSAVIDLVFRDVGTWYLGSN